MNKHHTIFLSILFVTILNNVYVQSNTTRKTEIQIVVDFLNTEPTKNIIVEAYVCWTKKYKMKLLNILLENNFTLSVLDVEEKYIQNMYHHHKHTIILDIDCKNYSNLLKKANELYMFSSSYTWILFSKSSTISQETTETLTRLDIYPDSNVILVQKQTQDKFLLREIYKYNKNSTELVRKVFALWRKKDKFGNFRLRVFAVERQNLNGTTMVSSVVIVNNDTLNHMDDYRFTHIDSISKVNFKLVKHLVEYVNASLIMNPVDSWGYLNKTTNTYGGMIGSMDTIAEIAGTPLYMTLDRVEKVAFLSMTNPTKIQFVFRQPPLSYQQNIFTLPFTRELWISSFCLVLLAIFLLYTTVYWEWSEPNLEHDPTSLRSSFLDVVMLTFAAVAQQGSTFEPRSAAGKIIMIYTFIALMFLYVSYSANIVALLQSSATNIRTLEDLLESRLKIGAADTVYNRYFLRIATEPTRKAIYEKKIAPPGQPAHFMSLAEGIRRVREGFFAFHMELGPGYRLMSDTYYEHEKCGIQEIKFVDMYDTYFAVRKNSTYKEIFKLGLRKLRESGIQNRELSRIYAAKPECHTAAGNFVSVGLIDSYSAFLFLGAGYFISLLLFILENIASKNKNIHSICLKINK